MSDWTIDELVQKLKNNPDLAKAQLDKINHNLRYVVTALEGWKIPASQNTSLPVNPSAKKPSKYGAQRTEYNSVVYASKKEAQYAQNLDLCRKAGEIQYWLRQVPFMLPGKTVYRVDFMEVNKDNSIDFVDVKGFDTPISKLKRRQVEAQYPIHITIIK